MTWLLRLQVKLCGLAIQRKNNTAIRVIINYDSIDYYIELLHQGKIWCRHQLAA